MLFIGLAEFICLIGIPVTFIGFLIQLARKRNTKKKWGFTCVGFCILLIACIMITPATEQDDGGEKSSESIVSKEAESEKEEVIRDISFDTLLSDLMKLGFTEDEAKVNREILLKCGISDITNFAPTDSNASIDNLISYRYSADDNRAMWFTVDNRKIFYVAINGIDLYDESKGGYLMNIDDVHIPETSVANAEKIKLRDMTENILDKHFDYDVRYYDAWGVGREDDNYVVQCQISDGSILTDHWIYAYVWYEKTNDEFMAVNMKIDGKVYELD